jgi:glycosyltransferase involved in cell wall biosynthesis
VEPVRVIVFSQGHTFAGKSGGEARLIEIFKRLRDVETVVVTCALGESLYRAEGMPARYLVTTRETAVSSVALTYIRRIMRSVPAVWRQILPSAGDVLYSATDILTDTLPAFVLRLRDRQARWVVVVHHLYPNPLHRRGNGFAATLLGFLSQRAGLFLARRWADAVIVVNRIVGQSLVEMGFDAEKVHVVGNGVDLARLAGDSRPHHTYDGVFLGRFHRSKGLIDLPEIWKCVCAGESDFRLAIVGGGDDALRAELESRIQELGLGGCVDVLGILPDDEAITCVRQSRVFVFPSHEEGFGLALAEAMACGLPAVAWDLPAYREVFRSGLLAAPEGNVPAFAFNVRRLLEDAHLYDDLSRAAREAASAHDIGVVTEHERRVLSHA